MKKLIEEDRVLQMLDAMIISVAKSPIMNTESQDCICDILQETKRLIAALPAVPIGAPRIEEHHHHYSCGGSDHHVPHAMDMPKDPWSDWEEGMGG